ncbi:SCO family protein [Sphingomonas sp.]|uniref:SCO family protein n=1 Tax=Sphingomonas sp. TaxID=28214 RepID=UPI0035BBAC63
MRRALVLAMLAAAAPASAALSERELARAVARPAPDARLPAALAFTDQERARVTLGQAAGGKPMVLIFADYTCPHVCSPGLALAARALEASGLTPGHDYRVALIGIDPRDTAADARQMAAPLLSSPRLGGAVSVLRGDRASVAAATRALGFGYAHDADGDRFAHDAVLYVFAPDGHLRALLPELSLQPAAMRAALSGGGGASVGLAERVARLCYGLAAAHGVYGRAAVLALQGVSLLLLGAGAVFALRRRRRA